nr:hypothetical protein FVER53263_13888 [Fusarium verticillioides]
MPRDLQAQADELEKWWKRHNINGKRVAEKEGGASSVDMASKKTNLKAGKSKSARNVSSETKADLCHRYT